MKLYCMACGKPTDGGLFCSKACNDRQAVDPFCPTYDVATGQFELKCRSCMADLSRPGDLLGIQTTNGVSCIKCLTGMVTHLADSAQKPSPPKSPSAQKGGASVVKGPLVGGAPAAPGALSDVAGGSGATDAGARA